VALLVTALGIEALQFRIPAFQRVIVGVIACQRAFICREGVVIEWKRA
jgi:hypothetical protein